MIVATLNKYRRRHDVMTIEDAWRTAPRLTRRGSLVYSLMIREEWKLTGGQSPHGDGEVHPGTTPTRRLRAR